MPRYEYPSLRQGLVGAWCPSLGSGGSLLPDRSGGNNHGTLSNYTWAASGSGLSIDSGYMTAAPSAVFGVAASLTMWCRLNIATPTNNLLTGLFRADNVTTGFDNSVYPFSDGFAYMAAFRTSRIDSISLSPLVDRTRWHMVTIVTDGSLWQMWQNNIRVYSGFAEASVAFSPAVFSIGCCVSRYGTYTLNGQWDDFRLWNRAITPAERSLLASRRGIGLTPLTDRGGGLPRKMSVVNGAGVRKDGDLYVRTAMGWKLGIPAVNTGAGGWK